jgi:hypothetical protein
MTIHSLRTLEVVLTRDDERIDADEAKTLLEAAHDGGEIDFSEATALRALPRATDEARDVIEDFLSAPRSPPVLRALTGFDRSSFDDDVVVLAGEGRSSGSAGVVPHSRAWGSVKNGPMRRAHGSGAPASPVLTAEEAKRVAGQSPGAALDAAAKELGVKLGEGFVGLAHKSSSYDPQAPHWWGKCHAWAWAALSTELSARVDVGGPEGQRGLWLGGQWISRADLGNFLMGVADRIALGDDAVMFDAQVTALDLLQATAQDLLVGGGGFVADLHHDATHGGQREVWNQPFVGAEVTSTGLSKETLDGLVSLAKREGNDDAVSAKRVELRARYGNEQSDDWEGPWVEGTRTWNVYAVTNAAGVVVAAYLANDAKLSAVPSLPTTQTAELLEYVWKPSLAPIDAALNGTPNAIIDGDLNAREYRFFLGTVLKRGVPGAMRARFEAEVARLPAGRVDEKTKGALHQRFPGIAAAYTKEQWQRAFASRGL